MKKKVVDPNNKQLASRKGKTIRCSKCWQSGHRWNFCKNEPTDVPLGVYVDKRYMYPRPRAEVRKGKKASANPIEVVDSGNTTGNYHAYGHETPIEVQAPTMAKQPLVGNSTLVHTRAKCKRQTTVETIGSLAPSVVLPSMISSNSNSANAPWRPPGMTFAISSNAKNSWKPSGMGLMHNMQNQQMKKHRTLQKK
ncbi:hypothetical protein D8674_024606 [Pyrus ussuriensis x Pyrus communis]|uniref:Uncharacterized protein n=1 Tax=Pyrus ussuriensis x Pyrus communis TaxID=2448454 RepID=A0A5N5HGW8_9ROSA|nr:hypothetical protein D8674_024606 [Pyrus ussuriensis x Pyrus communis]